VDTVPSVPVLSTQSFPFKVSDLKFVDMLFCMGVKLGLSHLGRNVG